MIVSTMYRFGFFVEVFVEFGYSFARMIFVVVLYQAVSDIAGWSYYELMFLMGLNILSSELVLGPASVFNLRDLPENIKNGAIDILLTKPVNSLFALTLWKPYFPSYVACLPGIFFMTYAYIKLGLAFSVIHLLSGLFLFICGNIIAYCFYVIFASFSFVLINSRTLISISEVLVLNFKINPHQVYDGVLGIVFWFIIPVVFMSSLPAEALLQGIPIKYLGLAALLTLSFLVLTTRVWNFMLSKYTSAGG